MSAKPTLVQLILNATAAGKSMLTAANAAAQKTLLSLVKGDVGLGSVDNTSDANKPVSTAQQAALDAKQATLVSGTNIKTVNSTSLLGSGDITVGVSGTGSVDNAALRADGTGGATLQNSAWIINDNLTASPNNTVNHACIEATGGTTNVSVSIKPKGTGSFSLHAPDATATGGNARGVSAVDLQQSRATAAQIASGNYSTLLGGSTNTASQYCSIAGGESSIASGIWSACFGSLGVASGAGSACFGYFNTSSGSYSFTFNSYNAATATDSFAHGMQGKADKKAQRSHSGGAFAVAGDAQGSELCVRNSTTNATPTELFIDGASLRLTIATDTTWAFSALVVARRTDADNESAAYRVEGCIDRNGTTTALVGSVTVTVLAEDNAAWDVTAEADDTNDALVLKVTGESGKTIRWFAWVRLSQVTG